MVKHRTAVKFPSVVSVPKNIIKPKSRGGVSLGSSDKGAAGGRKEPL